jgi:hypothetical protein
MTFNQPNKPDAANPAMMLELTIEGQWRRVADLGRYAKARDGVPSTRSNLR